MNPSFILFPFHLLQMNDNIAKGGTSWFESGLPELPEVTLDNVRYDMQVGSTCSTTPA